MGSWLSQTTPVEQTSIYVCIHLNNPHLLYPTYLHDLVVFIFVLKKERKGYGLQTHTPCPTQSPDPGKLLSLEKEIFVEWLPSLLVDPRFIFLNNSNFLTYVIWFVPALSTWAVTITKKFFLYNKSLSLPFIQFSDLINRIFLI